MKKEWPTLAQIKTDFQRAINIGAQRVPVPSHYDLQIKLNQLSGDLSDKMGMPSSARLNFRDAVFDEITARIWSARGIHNIGNLRDTGIDKATAIQLSQELNLSLSLVTAFISGVHNVANNTVEELLDNPKLPSEASLHQTVTEQIMPIYRHLPREFHETMIRNYEIVVPPNQRRSLRIKKQ